jgi:hypothetical protein
LWEFCHSSPTNNSGKDEFTLTRDQTQLPLSRFHHYFAGLVFTPGTFTKTRMSALLQAFLLGMFLNGVARWNFDPIYQTPASLVGDGTRGTEIPRFVTNSTNFLGNETRLVWAGIPEEMRDRWTGFSLLVDDVERYEGGKTDFDLEGIDGMDWDIPHYFRIAYKSKDGVTGDFTMAATGDWRYGSWIDPDVGSS